MKRDEPLNRSVRRTVIILEYLAGASGPQELGTISRDLKMSKSTVYRFLSTLAEDGYVHQDPGSGHYSLGSKVTWLAAKYFEKNSLTQIARPHLEALSKESGETVHLAILDQDEVAYIDKIDGRQAVLMASRIGIRMPVNSTALGKVLMADQPESEWRRYVAEVGLKARTPNTLTDPERFYTELRCVREQSYAIDELENEDGIRCIAAPIRDSSGRAVAAFSVSGWTLTMTPEKVHSLIPAVLQTAQSISARLGFQTVGEAPGRAGPAAFPRDGLNRPRPVPEESG